MMRGWAYGFLALLFLVTLVQGSQSSRGNRSLVANPNSPAGEYRPATRFAGWGSDPAVIRALAQGKRDRDGNGDEPSSLPTLLVVAIALFYALPLRGSDIVRALRIGLTPEGRHREAGRCPTGPPAFA